MKQDPHILGLSLSPDLHQWVRHQSSPYHKSETDIATALLLQGLRIQTVDDTIAAIRAAAGAYIQRETLRQTLVTRYIIEMQSKGVV